MESGHYAKDLLRITGNLQRTVLVDNNYNSFAIQKSNGIPISSFYDDADDIALTKLMKLLLFLDKVNDVRPRLKMLFKLGDTPRSACR